MTAQPTESAPAEPAAPAQNVEDAQRSPRTERIKRILVALDVSEHGRVALEAAAALAARLSAELLVLHIEDIDLLHLAALPFAHEIDARALARRLETTDMERALKAGARRATQTFERAAAGWQIRASFRVVRGGVTREILTAAEDVDLLFVGRAGVTRSRRSRLGRTTRSLLGSDSCAVAVLGDRHALERPIATVFDGSEGSLHALDIAIALAGEDHHNLLVAIPDWPGARAASLETLAEAATRMAAPDAIEPRCIALSPPAMARLPEWLREQGCRGLVVDRGAALFEGRAVAETVEAFDCPVIVVR